MKKPLVLGALVLALGACGAYAAFRTVRAEPSARARAAAAPSEVRSSPRTADGFRSGIFEPPREAPAFTLDGSNGRKLNLADQRGKVVILEFGYTHCQYVCPMTLARLTDVHRKLGKAASDVQLIYVTVDPKRDTPERLREHLAAFNPSFLGATGTPDELAATLKGYGVVAEQVVSKGQAPGYEVDHSSFLYLVDRQGRIRGLVPFGTSADDIRHDVELLLKMPA
jgi:protein SCO1/2